jgi:hypothetical protein
MIEKFEIGIVILGYVVRNTILGESLINWIDQLYGIPQPPVFDLNTVVREKIYQIINKYNLTNLQNINIDLQDLSNLQPMFDLIRDARLNNPLGEAPEEDLIFIHYINGLHTQQIIKDIKTVFPNVDLSTPWDNAVTQKAILQTLLFLDNQDDYIYANTTLEHLGSHEAYLELERLTHIVPTYQTRLRETFDAAHRPIKFTQRKFLNVSLSDLLTSRTSFIDVAKNFATGLYNFFKGYMSTPSVVETPLDTTSLNGNNVQNRRVLGVN